MTRVVGRVTQPNRFVGQRGQYAEPSSDEELERIGREMKATNSDAGLREAIRIARERGFSWARIGGILGTTRQSAWERFRSVDEASEGAPENVPVADVPVADEETPAVEPVPQQVFDFSSMKTLTNDEIAKLGEQLPRDVRYLKDPYLIALREAIVVELYKRDLNQHEIAAVIGKSSQRVSQLLTGYYDRVERQWAVERASWKKER